MVYQLAWFMVPLLLHPPEGASTRKSIDDSEDFCLHIAEDNGDFIASWALDIHEIRIRALYQTTPCVKSSLLERHKGDLLREAYSGKEVFITAGRAPQLFYPSIY